MKKNRVSANDVAERAGVSRTTVSFIFNNTPGKHISESTRQKVLKAADELRYTPNEAAQALALSRHRTVGLLVCHTNSALSDTYIVRVIEGMSQVLNRYRYRLVILPVRLDVSNYLEIARQNDIDGIIVINVLEHDRGLEELFLSHFPLVVIGTVSSEGICQVDINNRTASREGVEYLIELRHRKVAMITQALPQYHATQERISGYREALEAAGIPVRPDWIQYGDFTEQSGYAAMQKLLALEEKPTAVYAARDLIAYGAMQAIKDAGLSIPGDISVLGFDDDLISRYLNPPLTCVSLPAASIGAEAAEFIVKILSGTDLPQNVKTVATRLSRRESCRELTPSELEQTSSVSG